MLAAIAVPSKSLPTEEVFIVVSPFTGFPENLDNFRLQKRHRHENHARSPLLGASVGRPARVVLDWQASSRRGLGLSGAVSFTSQG
jgi:hypothetical protein